MEGGVLLHSLLALSCTDVGNAARDVRVHIPPVGGERDFSWRANDKQKNEMG